MVPFIHSFRLSFASSRPVLLKADRASLRNRKGVYKGPSALPGHLAICEVHLHSPFPRMFHENHDGTCDSSRINHAYAGWTICM